MAEEKKEEKKTEKKLDVVKPSVDFPVRVIATEADPYHETDKEFDAGAKKAIELEKRGWVKFTTKAKERIEELRKLKLLSVLLVLSLFSFAASAQVPADFRSVYNLTSDTVTNTGVVLMGRTSRQSIQWIRRLHWRLSPPQMRPTRIIIALLAVRSYTTE